MRCLIIREASVGGRKSSGDCVGRPTPDAGKSALRIGNADVSAIAAAGEIGSAVVTASKPPGGAVVSVLTLPGAIYEFVAAKLGEDSRVGRSPVLLVLLVLLVLAFTILALALVGFTLLSRPAIHSRVTRFAARAASMEATVPLGAGELSARTFFMALALACVEVATYGGGDCLLANAWCGALSCGRIFHLLSLPVR